MRMREEKRGTISLSFPQKRNRGKTYHVVDQGGKVSERGKRANRGGRKALRKPEFSQEAKQKSQESAHTVREPAAEPYPKRVKRIWAKENVVPEGGKEKADAPR